LHKIAFYLLGNETGGAAQSIASLIKNIDRQKYDIHAAVCSGGEFWERLAQLEIKRTLLNVNLPEQMQIVDKDFVGYSKKAAIKNIKWFFSTIIALRKYLKENKISIVHSNGGHQSITAGLAAKLAGVKSVWHQRGLLSGAVPMKILNGPLSILAQTCADKFIGISESVVNSMPENWRSKAIVVYNGIEFSELDESQDSNWLRSELKIGHDRQLVGILGSIVAIKGHSMFIDAAKIVHDRRPDVVFIIIGDAPLSCLSLKQDLIKKTETLGLSSSFRWLGKVPLASRYVGGMNLLVSATQPPGEGFGLTIVEAMSQGLPVVATSCGATPELISDGETGYLVQPTKPDDMAEIILKILDNQELYAQLSKNAKDWSRSKFSIRNTASGVEQVYYSLLDNHS
jgi:glycosyltransferase involved in cell wall biosynthesis